MHIQDEVEVDIRKNIVMGFGKNAMISGGDEVEA